MDSLKKRHFLILLGSCLALTSCAKVSSVASRAKIPKFNAPSLTSLKMPNLKVPKFKKPRFALLKPKNFSWKSLRAGKRVPIVDVREKDLKKVKSGEQLYLAYNKKKKKYGYYSGRQGKKFTPVDFDPSQLPDGETGHLPTTGLLPSLSSETTLAVGSGNVGDLPPVDLPEIPDDLKMPEDFGTPALPTPADFAPPVPPTTDPAPAFLESIPAGVRAVQKADSSKEE